MIIHVKYEFNECFRSISSPKVLMMYPITRTSIHHITNNRNAHPAQFLTSLTATNATTDTRYAKNMPYVHGSAKIIKSLNTNVKENTPAAKMT